MNHETLGPSHPTRAGLRDRVLALRSHTMFEGLDDDGLLLLAERGRSGSYADGETIAAEDEPARWVYLVVSGEIAVFRHGKPITQRRTGEGYGALPLLAGEGSTLAVAVGETRTLEVPAAAFESALIENYSLLRNTLGVFGASVLATRDNLPADPEVPRAIDEGHYYPEPRTLVEILIQLRQGPFGHMNLDALVDMARYMLEVRYPAGELLWSAGETSTHALHVDAGRVRCTVPDGRAVAVGRGFTIGVLDVWTRSRVYEARTETPVIAFRLDFESFLAMLETHPEVGLDLLRGFARELVNVHEGR
jgi:CRP-like cAMP-binding protein